jgi:sec-independent protein translocase protein TatA
MIEGLFQPMHLLLILIIATLVFGPKKLPELGRNLGEGIRGFRDGIKNAEKGASLDDAHASIDPAVPTPGTSLPSRVATGRGNS